jgi:hypothetical protein
VVTHFTGRGGVPQVGSVSSSSGAAGRSIAKSWNYTEFFPLNWVAVADYQAAHHGLYGRYPSFGRLMKNARIKTRSLSSTSSRRPPGRASRHVRLSSA